ncbi:MAG: lipopolysaccharide transport periplasmic protein LptA [Arenicellales bacterium]
MNKQILTILSFCAAFSMAMPSYALSTDQSQPATLDADEFDLDFQTGVRTYRGNVVYQQGSIRLYADEIVAYVKDGELERVIARGNPAKFLQRPDDSDTDMVGIALRIELDDAKQIVILQNRAKVTQDANTITGKRITYNMATEKVNVKSGPRTKPARVIQQTVDTSNMSEEELEAALETVGDKVQEVIEESSSNRPRLVIKPRKKTK